MLKKLIDLNILNNSSNSLTEMYTFFFSIHFEIFQSTIHSQSQTWRRIQSTISGRVILRFLKLLSLLAYVLKNFLIPSWRGRIQQFFISLKIVLLLRPKIQRIKLFFHVLWEDGEAPLPLKDASLHKP